MVTFRVFESWRMSGRSALSAHPHFSRLGCARLRTDTCMKSCSGAKEVADVELVPSAKKVATTGPFPTLRVIECVLPQAVISLGSIHSRN
jgi:hypothetical protein